MFDLLCFMRTCDHTALENVEFTRLLKNLKTNFFKVYSTVEQILHHESMGLDLAGSTLLQAQLIEYGYLKISTIWDIAYQIADELLSYGRPPRELGKYGALQRRFEEYNRRSGFLQTDWYHDINAIRNRVVHGGINVMPFYVEKQLMFNAYDADVDSILPQCAVYTVENGLMASAGRYFMFYLGILYHYLCDFFAYQLDELRKLAKPRGEPDEHLLRFFSHDRMWEFETLDEYNSLAVRLHNLPLASERNPFIDSRLAVKRFKGEPGDARYCVDMVDSVLGKYRVHGSWQGEHRLRVALTPEVLEIFPALIQEIRARPLGLYQTSGNREENYVELYFS